MGVLGPFRLAVRKAYCDTLRDRKIAHDAALRMVANRLIGVLDCCLRRHVLYDEKAALGALESRQGLPWVVVPVKTPHPMNIRPADIVHVLDSQYNLHGQGVAVAPVGSHGPLG